jgi:hypothetical protein
VSDESNGRVSRTLGTVGVVITVIAGASALLFAIQPDLKPCIGAHEARFTGVPVFPGADYKAYLRRGERRSATSRMRRICPGPRSA